MNTRDCLFMAYGQSIVAVVMLLMGTQGIGIAAGTVVGSLLVAGYFRLQSK